MNKKKAKIVSKILTCKEQIDNLYPNIDKCESILNLYNKKIIEKAVLSKELETFDNNFVLKLVKKISSKKEKLISDYFS